MELESDVIAAFDLAYCDKESAAQIGLRIRRTSQLLNGLLRSAMRKHFDAKKFG